MTRRRNPRAGVTLLELLIAISLVSLLSTAVLVALRVGLNAMEKTNSRVIQNRRVLGAQRILEQQIAGMIVTVAECGIQTGGPVAELPFFQGQPQTMRFVSSYSLEEGHRGYPRILEYQVIPRDDGRGVRLIVNERYYTGPASTGRLCLGPGPPNQGTLFVPVEVGPRSFVLADRLEYCRFSYQKPAPEPVLREWVPVWSDREFPLAIRIDMAQLEPDPTGIPILPLTIPVRVNRIPGYQYVD